MNPATYAIDGPDEGPPIVFVHSTRLCHTMWRAQMDDLCDTYRVVALDLPGHGRLADRPFTVAGASDAVATAIEEAAGGHAVVVGLSLGGYVAMDLAARRPELVRGLVLAGATAEPIGLVAAPFLAFAWIMDRFEGPALDALNTWFFRTRFPPAIADPIIAGGFWSAGGARALRAIVGERFAPRLAAYPGRRSSSTGSGTCSSAWPPGTFARAARDARRVRLGGATHLANMDRPGAFNFAVRRFVEGLHRLGRAPGEPAVDRREKGPVLDLADRPRVP